MFITLFSRLGDVKCSVLKHDCALVSSLQKQTTRPQTWDLHGFFIRLQHFMANYSELIDTIAEQTGGEFRAASASDLAALGALGLPQTVLDFFAEFEPAECIEGAERLWPISEIVNENTGFVPGCNISGHGYIVFSTTGCGDTFCFDLNQMSPAGEPRIVFMSHETDYESMTAAEIHDLAVLVASNLYDFLGLFAREELGEF